MILYHGSNQKVVNVELGKSRLGKDFGRAFYLSEDENQAIEMAKFKVDTFGGKVLINKFEFDKNVLGSIHCKYQCFDSYTEEWARFILANRKNMKDIALHDNDVVYGPIAYRKADIQFRSWIY